MRFSLTFLLLCAALPLRAQQLTGVIADERQQPVAGAAVVLLAADSTYLDACVSDADGAFRLNKPSSSYRLIVQHLLYRTREITAAGEDAGVIFLRAKEHALDEVVVTARRPFVKVDNGRLGYDLSLLAGDGVVNNAYEALTKLPGIREKQGALTLTGAGSLTVILNGKPTTMNAGQLETLLRNTPLERVEKAEVMYSAPAEYHVRGAVVNVVLKRPDHYAFQGEVGADYRAQYFNGGGVTGNFRFSTPRTAFDVMYSAADTKKMEYMDLHSRHTLAGQLHDIRQNEQLRSKFWSHDFRGAVEHDFGKGRGITAAYTGSFIPRERDNSLTAGNYQTADVDKRADTRMHNLSLQYRSGTGLEIGGDYTHYTSDNDQRLHTEFRDGSQRRFSLVGGQRIDRYSFYADRKHSLPREWSLGYGASYRLAEDRDFQTYEEVTGDIEPRNTASDLKEHTAGFYLSLGKDYASGTSFSVSATGEYYAIGEYRKWAVYPQASLTWSKTPKHLLQLSLSTDKTYPGYWDMQSSVSYLNGYTELWGTPGLRPMTAYNLNGSYILDGKYVFSLFFQHTSDYFIQTAYQSTERLTLIYKNANWDYERSWGANVVLPFRGGDWFSSRLTLTGMRMRQRCDDFFDIPFDRTKWMFGASLDNTFKVRENLSFELTAYVQTPTIQGTFDIGRVFDLTAGVKWSFAKDRMTLTARCGDLFNTAMPRLKVRFKGQWLDMNSAFYSRTVAVHFGYRFGGYRKKELKGVDTSRFGH